MLGYSKNSNNAGPIGSEAEFLYFSFMLYIAIFEKEGIERQFPVCVSYRATYDKKQEAV